MTGWSITFSPYLPDMLMLGLTIALAIFAFINIAHLQRGAFIRLLTAAALIISLLNPQLEREIRESLSNIIAVVVDESASQSVQSRKKDAEDALKNIEQQVKALPNTELRVIRSSQYEKTQGDGTNLFSAMFQGLTEIPTERLSGVLFLTDGAIHDASAGDQKIIRTPLHALITGEKKEIDRRIMLRAAPRYAILGQHQKINLEVSDTPARTSDSAILQILQNGKQISEKSIRTNEPFEYEISLDKPGDHIFEFVVAPLEGELTQLNNRAAVTIKGVRENLRVLLISGEPHSGLRTWRNLLKADPAVDLVHFTILRPPDKIDGTPIRELSLIAFPVRELFQEKIKDFDLIIFDRYEKRGILPMAYFDNMARYVKEGGAMLIVSGPEDAGVDSLYMTSLASVLPAEPTGALHEKPYLPVLSAEGKKHPVTRNLTADDQPKWSRWFRQVVADIKSGTTLMQGAGRSPLLVLDRIDEGRIALLMSDQVWLWARNFEGGGPHTELLRRIVHWLMKEPDLEEESLRATQEGERLKVERQSMAQASSAVQIQRPDGAIENLRLQPDHSGLWQGSIQAPLAGLYRLTQGSQTALVTIGPANPREYADILSTTDILAPVTKRANGTTQRLKETGEISVPSLRLLSYEGRSYGSSWLGFYDRNVFEVKGIEKIELLKPLLGVFLLLTLLCGLWYRESR